jgi:DNA helicase-2/ATP-dependent DNA helicase PcrA
MTVHSAKGLEFPVVFLAGIEEGIFPSSQCIGNEEEISEERRLAYVAITRAKEKLYLTHAKNRMMYGKTSFNPLSRFVRDEIPEKLIEHEMPKRQSGAKSPFGFGSQQIKNTPFKYANPFGETAAKKPAPFGAVAPKAPTQHPNNPRGAESYGVEKFAPGTRVSHSVFGDGEIISARDMGGDVLYEVKFDSNVTKKLMATFAKLVKI